MTRKYNQQTYTGSYQGSAQSLGFNPIKAVDTSKQFEQRTQERNRDLATYSNYLKRQNAVASSQLAANKAKSNANFAALKGLTTLAKQGIGAIQEQQKYAEQAEAERQEQEILDEQTGFLFGGETPRLDAAADKADQQDAAAFATSDAAAQVSDNPDVQEAIVKPTADALAARSNTKITSYEASARIGADLDDFMGSDTLITLPDGRKIRARDATGSAEIAAVAAQGIQQLTRGYGLAGMDPKVLRNTYLGSARNAYSNAITNRSRITRQAAQGERAVAHYGAASQEIQAGQDPSQVYQTLYRSLQNSQVEIDPRKLNKMVREHMIAVASGMGPEGIRYLESMKNVQQVPGQRGTELGMGPYAAEIDNAIRRIRTGAVSDYRTTQNEQAIDIDRARIDHQKNILTAETEEERIQINEAYESSLEIAAAGGNQAAFKELQAQRSIDNRYNPNAMGELMDDVAQGRMISEDTVNQAVASGALKPSEGKAVLEAAGSNVVEAVSSKLKPYQSGWEKQMSAEISAKMKSSSGISLDRAETAIYAQDATRILNEEMSDWMAANPDANPAQIQQEAQRRSKAIVDRKVTGDIDKDPTYQFDTPTVPTQTFTNTNTGQQARNMQFMTTNQLQALQKDNNKDNDIDIYNDNLLTQDSFRAEISRMQEGQDFSPRVKQLASIAGVTPRSIMYAQSIGKGIDLNTVLSKNEPTYSGSEPTDIQSGARYLQSMGYTAKGAAYLAANIQQESSWNGMREWGGVWNPTTGQMDGTSRNGGLVSWASWSNDPARLGAIENYLGKPISQATHAEQLEAMKWEMSTNPRFANAYRTFTNPNATDAQLRRASYEYWGYGHEGVNRFGSYLDQALVATNG